MDQQGANNNNDYAKDLGATTPFNQDTGGTPNYTPPPQQEVQTYQNQFNPQPQPVYNHQAATPPQNNYQPLPAQNTYQQQIPLQNNYQAAPVIYQGGPAFNIIYHQEKSQYYIRYNSIYFGIQAFFALDILLFQISNVGKIDPETGNEIASTTSVVAWGIITFFYIATTVLTCTVYNMRINRETVDQYKRATTLVHIAVIICLIFYIIITAIFLFFYVLLILILGASDPDIIPGFPQINTRERGLAILIILFFMVVAMTPLCFYIWLCRMYSRYVKPSINFFDPSHPFGAGLNRPIAGGAY